MLKKIAYFITRKKIAKQNTARQKQFLSWHKIEKIALIVDDKEALNRNETDKFIEGIKKYVEVFYLELNSQQSSFGDWKCITKKDKTILHLPKNAFLDQLRQKKYDLVINVSDRYQLFSATMLSAL